MCNNGCYGCDQLTDDNACLLGALRGMKRCKRTAEENHPKQAEASSLSDTKCQDDLLKKFGPMTHTEVIQKYPQQVWEMVKKQHDRIAELEADKERLDWIERHCRTVERPGTTTADWCFDYRNDSNLREAIDKARK